MKIRLDSSIFFGFIVIDFFFWYYWSTNISNI